MKKSFLVFIVLVIALSTTAQKKSNIKLLQETPTRMVIEMDLGDLAKKSVATPQGEAIEFSLQGGGLLQKKGAPSLPLLAKSIIIPTSTSAKIKVLETDFMEYNSMILAPSKGKISRAQDEKSIAYTYGEEYQKDDFFPTQKATLEAPYLFRDFHGQAIQFFPVQYNPVQKIVRVYSRIQVEVTFDQTSEMERKNENKKAQVVEEFDAMYTNHFLNYSGAQTTANKGTRYSPVTEIGSMLVICPTAYLPAILPYIKWKEMKGIKTFLATTDTISGGVNEASIANLVSQYYQKEQIVYALLVGDNTDIPARNESKTSAFLFGPSDIAYGYQPMTDHRPEIIVGRFSGENLAEIETQVKRTLNYEQNPTISGSWMGTQIGIASSIGPNDDNQYDYEHIHEIVDSNKNQYNYVTNLELYDGVPSRGGTDLPGNPNNTMLLNAINQGASLINYAGHGAADGIVTCGFTTPDVASIQNENQLPFFLVVGCQPGNFLNGTSFSEAIIREGGSTPRGVISSYMSTVDQWIPEPMEMQDEFNAVMRGARPGNVKNRLGAMCISGSLAMMDKYDTPANDYGGQQMMDTWVFFGDPTLSLFNKYEGALTISNTAHVYQNQTFLDVYCPIEGATIGLYYQGKFLSVANVVGGFAHCTFPPISGLDTIFVTATKQNYAPASSYSVTVDWALSTQSIDVEKQIAIFPNPSSTQVQIVSANQNVINHIILQDVTGKVLLIEKVNATQKSIDVSAFANGIYLIRIEMANGSLITKFTKN